VTPPYTEPSPWSRANSEPSASSTSRADTILSPATFDKARRTAASTVPVRSASNPRPFLVRLSRARRPSRGSRFLYMTPRPSSRWRMPVSVLGWTHKTSASFPAEIPGNRPTIRITRRWGPVMPRFLDIRFDVEWRPWSNIHRSRISSRTSPRRATFSVRIGDSPRTGFVVIVCLTPYTCFIRNYPVRFTCASHAPRFDSALYAACNEDSQWKARRLYDQCLLRRVGTVVRQRNVQR